MVKGQKSTEVLESRTPAAVITLRGGSRKEEAWAHLAGQPATRRHRGRAALLANQQLPGLQGTVCSKDLGSSKNTYSANGKQSDTKRKPASVAPLSQALYLYVCRHV